MMNIKKRLSIVIDDTREDEEETQNFKIQKECSSLKMLENQIQVENYLKYLEDDRNKILELNNPIINQILFYMESENVITDFSYTW